MKKRKGSQLVIIVMELFYRKGGEYHDIKILKNCLDNLIHYSVSWKKLNHLLLIQYYLYLNGTLQEMQMIV